jgi:hypothetical protein
MERLGVQFHALAPNRRGAAAQKPEMIDRPFDLSPLFCLIPRKR